MSSQAAGKNSIFLPIEGIDKQTNAMHKRGPKRRQKLMKACQSTVGIELCKHFDFNDVNNCSKTQLHSPADFPDWAQSKNFGLKLLTNVKTQLLSLRHLTKIQSVLKKSCMRADMMGQRYGRICKALLTLILFGDLFQHAIF